jgi:hypothetical protein
MPAQAMKRLAQLACDLEPRVRLSMLRRVFLVIDRRKHALFEAVVSGELHPKLCDTRKHEKRLDTPRIEGIGKQLAAIDERSQLVVLRPQLCDFGFVHIVDENFASPGSW